MKKMTKKEIEKVTKDYNLGKLKEYKYLEGGLINYNYDVKTEKGNFILRILGSKINKWKKEKIKVELEVLNFLHEKEFPYKTPFPLINKNKKIVTRMKGNYLWVYKKIKGKKVRRLNNRKLEEMAKALGLYHKKVRNLKVKEGNYFYNLDWLIKYYEKMEKIKPKNELDLLMLEGVRIIFPVLKKYNKIKFKKKLPAHCDFSKHNVLFKGDKMEGIIDFDNLEVAPRIADVSYVIKSSCKTKGLGIDRKKEKIFLKEYEKYQKLTKKEKDAIPFLILLDESKSFWWFYMEMEKKPELKKILMEITLKRFKRILKEI